MNENRFYTLEEEQTMRFYQMPKALFGNDLYEGLSLGAKATYSILRDRQDLSIKNNWIDEEGHIYSNYSVKSLCEVLEVSNKTAIAYKKELVKVNLIIDKRMGQGKSNRLYILKIEPPQTLANTLKCRNYTTRSVESTSLEVYNLHTSDTEFNETDINNTQSIIKEEKQEEQKKEQKEKDDGLNEIVNNLNLSSLEEKDKTPIIKAIKILYNSKKGITSNGIHVQPSEIREDLQQLEYKHIEQALKDYQEAYNRSQITNPSAYLSSCIYNAMFKPEIKEFEKVDYNKNKTNTKFHNFEQRTSKYSPEELEKMVLKKK